MLVLYKKYIIRNIKKNLELLCLVKNLTIYLNSYLDREAFQNSKPCCLLNKYLNLNHSIFKKNSIGKIFYLFFTDGPRQGRGSNRPTPKIVQNDQNRPLLNFTWVFFNSCPRKVQKKVYPSPLIIIRK